MAEKTKALDTTPLYAVAGVGDLAVEKIRTIPTRLAVLRTEARGDVAARVAVLQDGVKELPGAVLGLPALAQHLAGTVGERAAETYDELAERGKVLVGRIRRQASTQEAEKQAKNTVRRAKATRTTARKSATATKRAVEDAAEKIG